MASKKAPKTELVAICKLEFYKKQKSWKFCSQERKARDSKRRNKTANAKLNQTYNIAPCSSKKEDPVDPDPADPEPEDAERLDLDEAFVETETGTASESDEPVPNGQETDKPQCQQEALESLYSPRWSIQRWAERHRLWEPEPTTPSTIPIPTHDPTCLNLNPTFPAYDPTAPYHSPTCPTLEPNYPTSCIPDPTFDNNYNKLQQDIYSNRANPRYDPQSDKKLIQEQFDPKYGASVVYYNSKLCQRGFDVPQSGLNVPQSGLNVPQCGLNVPQSVHMWNVKEWDDYELCAGEGAAWNEPEWLAEAAWAAAGPGGEDAVDGDWRLDLSTASQCDSLPSITSGEFIRGAALAPHSTQIDLLLGPEPAAALTGRALAAAVARHSAALRDLLHEAQRRQMIPKEAPTELYSYDEVPVRDPGPALHHLPPRPFNDPLVAGSYRTTPDLRGHTGQTYTQGEINTLGQIYTQGQTYTQGQCYTPGQSCTQGQNYNQGQTCTQGQNYMSGQSCTPGQSEGRGRGRLTVGIRMGRPYRV